MYKNCICRVVSWRPLTVFVIDSLIGVLIRKIDRFKYVSGNYFFLTDVPVMVISSVTI